MFEIQTAATNGRLRTRPVPSWIPKIRDSGSASLMLPTTMPREFERPSDPNSRLDDPVGDDVDGPAEERPECDLGTGQGLGFGGELERGRAEQRSGPEPCQLSDDLARERDEVDQQSAEEQRRLREGPDDEGFEHPGRG